MPIGATYHYLINGWSISPNAEIDPLLWGDVNSYYAAIPSALAPNLSDRQSRGIGFRGELMFGQQYQHFSWEAGPFFRFWWIKRSDGVVTPNSAPLAVIEPTNTRLQAGAAVRVNF